MAQLPKFWDRLTDAIGAPGLRADPRFAAMGDRLENRAQLTAILDDIFMQAPTAHWIERLGGQCPVAPVHDLAQALTNSFIHQRGMVMDVPHPARPDMRALASPILVDGARLPARHAPALGADTGDILAELGFDSRAVADLRARGVV